MSGRLVFVFGMTIALLRFRLAVGATASAILGTVEECVDILRSRDAVAVCAGVLVDDILLGEARGRRCRTLGRPLE